jgi:hypothetical protein
VLRKGNGPAETAISRDPAHSHYPLRRTTVDTTDSSAPAHPSTEAKHLAKLEERQALRDRVIGLRRRLSR